MPSPGNGILRVDEKASLWDVVGENLLLPRVHLRPLQLLVPHETGKTDTQDIHVMSIHRSQEKRQDRGIKKDRKLLGFTKAAPFGDHQKKASLACSCRHLLF